MDSQISRLIGMNEMAMAGQKITGKTKARLVEGKCLICEKLAHRRGLCIAHYAAFRKQLQGRPRSKQGNFETACINAGKILAQGQIRDIKSNDPFRDIKETA
jgi:hypothetical protein